LLEVLAGFSVLNEVRQRFPFKSSDGRFQ
jgi:hypothetical protein